MTNVKVKDKPSDKLGTVYKIKCSDCQATYIGETDRNMTLGHTVLTTTKLNDLLEKAGLLTCN